MLPSSGGMGGFALADSLAQRAVWAMVFPGYDGAGTGILIPVKPPPGGRELDLNTRTRNAIQHSLRCLGEEG